MVVEHRLGETPGLFDDWAGEPARGWHFEHPAAWNLDRNIETIEGQPALGSVESLELAPKRVAAGLNIS